SALSLQYLVLDEFHSYDGAQGTDVSILLRRLGQTLKSYWQDGHDVPTSPAAARITAADRARPLGTITPVATSATLGDEGDPSVMCGFAEPVFGEPFGPDAVLTESRQYLDDWAAGAAQRTVEAGYYAVDSPDTIANLAGAVSDQAEPADTTAIVLHRLYTADHYAIRAAVEAGDQLVLDHVKAHP